MNGNTVGGIIAAVGLGGALAYSIWKQHDLNKSIDKLTGKVHVDVEDPYIKEVVDRAVDREVNRKITAASNKAIDSIRSDMEKEIRRNVNSAYSDLKSDVKKEMQRQVKDISVESIRQEVLEEAKEAAVAKFKDDMDVILKGYNSDLENIRKIYANIAKTLESSNEKKTTTFTIG